MIHGAGHARALGIKFTYTFVIIFFAFALSGSASPVGPTAAAIAVTGLTYALGDLWVLPRFGSKAGAGAEAVLSGLIIWAVQLVLFGFTVPVRAILVAAVLIGLTELVFHRLLSPEILYGPEPPET